MSSIAVEMNATITTKRLGCGSNAGHEPIKQTDFLFLQGNLEGYQSASDPNPRRLDDLEGNPGAQSPAASSFLKCMIAVDRDALTQEDWLV